MVTLSSVVVMRIGPFLFAMACLARLFMFLFTFPFFFLDSTVEPREGALGGGEADLLGSAACASLRDPF